MQESSIFRKVPRWQDLRFFQKTEVLYQMTFVFCHRFLPHHGDRTVDQMLQAARSGKQNIVEGTEDGKTSSEMELKLLNVARSSIGELRQDYEDFLKSRQLAIWSAEDKRHQSMQSFTKSHNLLKDYESFFHQWTAEEMANVGLTLCFQVDAMMNKYLALLEQDFVTEGGIKERMYKARTGYRRHQEEQMLELKQQNAQLQQQLTQLQQQLSLAQEEAATWKASYEDLKQRALKAYYQQQDEIKALKDELEGR